MSDFATQSRPGRAATVLDFARFVAMGTLAAATIIMAVCALYLAKSALGINIFPGHSPLLHAAFYPFVRG